MVVLAVAGCGGGPRYHSTRGARLVHFTLHSQLVHRDLHEILVVPPHHGKWMLVLLHGYHAGPSQFLTQPFFDTLTTLRTPPEVLLLDGGADSYWHNRRDGQWGSMVLREAIPAGLVRTHAKRIALGGISMGGFGALLLGSRGNGEFCAVGAQSPALWSSAGATAPGAFDNPTDWKLHGSLVHYRPPHPLWIDLGASDPFRAATLSYAQAVDVRPHIKPGGHDNALWDAFTPQFLRFFTHACS